jgi:N12 class adenine-specific DNA methylase
MSNFQFDPSFALPKGQIGKAYGNLRSIELLKSIEAEGRSATPSEQLNLAAYVGWGGLAPIFNPTPDRLWAKPAELLKTLLEPDEYQSAFDSVLNAHYTSATVIREIYRGIDSLGFHHGRILEPSMGTGNFLGHMPLEMAKLSEVTGIELDSITGRIAKLLYPEHEIYVQGYQETILPDNYFDLAISNVPFGDYSIADPKYDHLHLKIHNYFFARAIDQVRPGGMIVFISSTGTMQSRSGQDFRAWISERADLIGAMRLPGNAFKTVAGTEVTTDLILLQKCGPEIKRNPEPWLSLEDTQIVDADGKSLQTNEYYVRHPEMMLGIPEDDKLYPGRLALTSDGRDLKTAMREAFDSLPRNVYRRNIFDPEQTDTVRVKLSPDQQIKQFGYVAQGEVLWQRRGEWLYPANLPKKTTERILGMLQVRDAVQDVFDIQMQGGFDEELQVAQQKLNRIYDDFVKRNGFISTSANVKAFQEDPDAQLLLALEQLDRDTGKISKADVFSRRTIRPRNIRKSADSSQEALIASLQEYGSVVPGYMAQLLEQPESDVLNLLVQQKLIFLDPESKHWQTQDEYLSGDVRHKLAIAQLAAQEDSQYRINVEELSAVQPRDLGPGEIEIRLGAPWLPTEVIQAFAQDLIDVDGEAEISVVHNVDYALWAVNFPRSLYINTNNNTIYGTRDLCALELLDLSLNLKDAAVYQRTSDGSRPLDVERTLAARVKQRQVQDYFKSWIWQDFERSEKLCQIYNQLYNGTVVRQFSNPNLEMPGSSPAIELQPHQKDAVWRTLQSRSTLLGHVVGAGKTFTMCAAAIEMRRLGLAQKPMIVVPNHMLGQFTNELYQLYPNAKVLAPSEKDTQKSKRKQLMARIATGDFDAVIVTHSAFTRLPVSPSARKKYLQDQLEELNDVLDGQDTKHSNSVVKWLARERVRLKERIKNITLKNKDDGVTFEQLGVDALLVDEAHYWKNLGRASKLTNIAGLSNTNSQRAMDAFIKSQIVSRAGGRLVFATGTPISNSIAEMYTMQRFLQLDTLKAKRLGSFDAWVGNFAEKVTAPEIDPTGRFKTKTRLARFTNVPELMALFRDVADIRTADQLNLPRPQVERDTIAAEASPLQLRYMARLIERAENVAARVVEPDEDNMLWITTDGRRASLDPRLISTELPDYPMSKVNRAIANTYAIWKATKDERLTQLIFCDLGTPKVNGGGSSEQFSLYSHIKAGLIQRGVPSEEIAFIHDAQKSHQKEILFAQMRNGQKRILIGSTEKCGVGMNIQARLVAEHHLDPPWRPSDIEQREGRILRQGNQNQKVLILTYVTQGRDGQLGFDAYSWQTLARKAEMVQQVMTGHAAARSVDDITTQALSFDEVKAIASGNPLIIEKATVDNRVSELSRYKQLYMNERYDRLRRINQLPTTILHHQKRIEQLTMDMSLRQETKGDLFRIKLGKTEYKKRTEAGEKLLACLNAARLSGKTGSQVLGEFAGFTLTLEAFAYGDANLKLRSSSGMIYTPWGKDTPRAQIYSLEDEVANIPKSLEFAKQQLTQAEESLEILRNEADNAFEFEDELEQLTVRQLEINTELGLYKDDQQAIANSEEDLENQTSSENQDEEDLVDQDPPDESGQALIDIDSLSSSDRDWNWLLEDESEIRQNILCSPSPEVLDAIARLHEFTGQPTAVEALLITAETPQDPIGDRTPEEGITASDPETPPAPDEQTLNQLRCWYLYAQALERPYLFRIQEVAQALRSGVPLSQKAIATMDGDRTEYSRAITDLIQEANAIVDLKGTVVPGGRTYTGQTYSIHRSTKGDISINAQDRGIVFELTSQRVTTTKVNRQDFDRFKEFSQAIAPKVASDRLQNPRQKTA